MQRQPMHNVNKSEQRYLDMEWISNFSDNYFSLKDPLAEIFRVDLLKIYFVTPGILSEDIFFRNSG